jgi:hypothetical protein
MKTLSIEEAARDFTNVLDEVERNQTEVSLVRNHHKVARIVPETIGLSALEMLSDLGGTLDKKSGAALARNVAANRKRKGGRLSELRNPWAS